jgi:D-alanyl-D-alanine carboxypeptidase
VRTLIGTVLLVGLSAVPVWAQLAPPARLSAESVLLLDTNGKVLYAKNPAEDHAPASLVKMMTLYLAFEDLEAGRARWDEDVTVSAYAARTPRFRLRLREGEVVPFHVLLEGVAVASANDAAVAVAEHLGGSEQAFVARMNAKAEVLGLRHTRFANPHGLTGPLQRTTAADMAVLTGRLVEDYPAAAGLLGSQSFLFRGRVHSRSIPLFDNPGGVQALKTGFTREAGYNLAVSAWRAGESYLLIVLGARTRSLSFRDARQLLRFAFGEIAVEEPEIRRRTAKVPPRRGRGAHRAKAPIPVRGAR